MIKERREKKLPVSGIWIKLKAKEISKNLGFRASDGWLSKFLSSNNLTRRKKTHVIQKLKEFRK